SFSTWTSFFIILSRFESPPRGLKDTELIFAEVQDVGREPRSQNGQSGRAVRFS
ncbi:uncharacterized, partial [Tachysurus ichikawai]